MLVVDRSGQPEADSSFYRQNEVKLIKGGLQNRHYNYQRVGDSSNVPHRRGCPQSVWFD